MWLFLVASFVLLLMCLFLALRPNHSFVAQEPFRSERNMLALSISGADRGLLELQLLISQMRLYFSIFHREHYRLQRGTFEDITLRLELNFSFQIYCLSYPRFHIFPLFILRIFLISNEVIGSIWVQILDMSQRSHFSGEMRLGLNSI